jgi:hypothetical protein
MFVTVAKEPLKLLVWVRILLPQPERVYEDLRDSRSFCSRGLRLRYVEYIC